MTTANGSSAPSVGEQARKSWYVFKHYNAGSSEDPMLSYMVGYRRGAADMLADLFQFGGWDVAANRIAAVLEELLVQRDAVRMVADETPEDPHG